MKCKVYIISLLISTLINIEVNCQNSENSNRENELHIKIGVSTNDINAHFYTSPKENIGFLTGIEIRNTRSKSIFDYGYGITFKRKGKWESSLSNRKLNNLLAHMNLYPKLLNKESIQIYGSLGIAIESILNKKNSIVGIPNRIGYNFNIGIGLRKKFNSRMLSIEISKAESPRAIKIYNRHEEHLNLTSLELIMSIQIN